MTPKHVPGRIVAVFVMLEGIAFLTIIIAAITSTFVARAERELEDEEAADVEESEDRVEARFDQLDARLDRLETMLRELTKA